MRLIALHHYVAIRPDVFDKLVLSLMLRQNISSPSPLREAQEKPFSPSRIPNATPGRRTSCMCTGGYETCPFQEDIAGCKTLGLTYLDDGCTKHCMEVSDQAGLPCGGLCPPGLVLSLWRLLHIFGVLLSCVPFVSHTSPPGTSGHWFNGDVWQQARNVPG